MSNLYHCEVCDKELDNNHKRVVGWTIGDWRNIALCPECYQRGKAEELYAQKEKYVVVHGRSTRWEDVLALN